MRMQEIVLEQIPMDGLGYLTVMHAGAYDQAEALALELGKKVNQPEVPIYDMPPAIITHGGPGILGVGFFARA